MIDREGFSPKEIKGTHGYTVRCERTASMISGRPERECKK